MFEQLKTDDAIGEVDQNQQLLDFVDLYGKFTQDAIRVSGLINAGRVTSQDRYRMVQFEGRVDAAWRNIPADKRAALIEALLVRKLLPEEVRQIIRTFDAKVVSLV